MLEEIERACQKCGAEPGQPCRTAGGNRTTHHKARRDPFAPSYNDRHARLTCWREGWKCGAQLMSTAQAHELATTYVAPRDFLDGWNEASIAAGEAHERARRRFMS